MERLHFLDRFRGDETTVSTAAIIIIVIATSRVLMMRFGVAASRVPVPPAGAMCGIFRRVEVACDCRGIGAYFASKECESDKQTDSLRTDWCNKSPVI
jgi:hypothetical protein